MTRSTDITSVTDYRQHLSDHLKRLRETHRPLFVTANGATEAVVLSPEAYDTLAEKALLADDLQAIRAGLEQVRSGKVSAFRKAMRTLAAKHGLALGR